MSMFTCPQCGQQSNWNPVNLTVCPVCANKAKHNGVLTCDKCGEPVAHKPTFTTGYGVSKTGEITCYACCAKEDEKVLGELAIGAYYTMYLVKRWVNKTSYRYVLTNWPGTFEISVCANEGRHNIAGIQLRGTFTLNGKRYSFINVGRNTEIATIKRLKDLEAVT